MKDTPLRLKQTISHQFVNFCVFQVSTGFHENIIDGRYREELHKGY